MALSNLRWKRLVRIPSDHYRPSYGRKCGESSCHPGESHPDIFHPITQMKIHPGKKFNPDGRLNTGENHSGDDGLGENHPGANSTKGGEFHPRWKPNGGKPHRSKAPRQELARCKPPWLKPQGPKIPPKSKPPKWNLCHPGRVHLS